MPLDTNSFLLLTCLIVNLGETMKANENLKPIEELFELLMIKTGLFDSIIDCENASSLLLSIMRQHPTTFQSVYEKMGIKYKSARKLAHILVSKGLAAFVEVPPSCNIDIRNNQTSKFNLLVLPPRESLEILYQMQNRQGRVKTNNLSEDQQEGLAELESDFTTSYGDNCLQPFIDQYSFKDIVPLRSAPKTFVFQYVLHQLREEEKRHEHIDVTFVTNKSTIFNHAPIQRFLIETKSKVNIANYFNEKASPKPQISSEIQEKSSVTLFSVPQGIIRDDRYVCLDNMLVSCHLRPVPYKNNYGNTSLSSYIIDISQRKESLTYFNEVVNEWTRLKLAKPYATTPSPLT